MHHYPDTDECRTSSAWYRHPGNTSCAIEQLLGAQLKYFKDGDATQKAFRSTKDGIHQYQDSDAFIGPADQIEQIKEAAKRDMQRNQQTRPDGCSSRRRPDGSAVDETSVDMSVSDSPDMPLSRPDDR